MVLSEVSVKRPVFAMVITILLMVFGWQSFGNLPVRERPHIESPVVSVVTRYPGANAEVVESRITQVVEDRVSGIEGIKSVTSSSSDGQSSVSIEFITSRDIESATNDVRDAIGRISRMLPEEVDFPEIRKVNVDERAIVWFGLTSSVLDPMALTDYAQRNLVDRLSVVPGVARIQISGEKRYSMRLWLDRQALVARGLTVSDVERALRSENVELPAGRLEGAKKDFSVRVDRSYKTVEDFSNLVIGRGVDGHLIRLGEVALVEVGPQNERSDYRANGHSNVGIGIVKQSTANTLDVATGAKAEVAKIQNILPASMALSASYDSSVFVEEAIKEVYRTLFIAIGLVMFVIYLFLGSFKAALIPSITVPVSLLATFMVLDWAGYSINLLTLLALVLAIGLVVDDAIVVLENIYRRVDEGEPALLAAYRGAKQVSFAVIATTLVLAGVFLPVIFLDGAIGRLFKELALTLVGAVGFSTLIALSLSPMMCSKLLSRKAKKTWLNHTVDNLFAKLSGFYIRILRVNFDNKSAVALTLIGAVLLSMGLLGRIKTEFTPQEDRGGFMLMIRAPEGSSFDLVMENVAKVEEKLMAGVERGDIDRLMFTTPGFGSRGDSVNSSFGIIILPHWTARQADTDTVLNWVRGEMREFVDIQAFPFKFGAGRGGGSGPIQFVVGANTYDDVVKFRDYILNRARANPGLRNVSADYQETRPELQIEVDKTRAADLGVSVQEIGRTLEVMLGGRRVTTYSDRGEEYDVVLRADAADRATPNDINNLYVRSSTTGDLISLSNLVTLKPGAGSGRLNRYNRIRALTISASLNEGYSMGEALGFLEDMVTDEMPEVVSVDYKGESLQFKESGNALIFAFMMAMLVVFLILAAQFESFLHPLIIMLTVPLAVAGALIGLFVMGDSLNLYSQVGIIILIGLASKNGILIVEFANQLRDAGKSVEEAIIEASHTRLRPIMMTGLSTAVGSLPLIMATGPGNESRGSIGIVVMSGVTLATVFTLIIIPTFYHFLAKYTDSPGAVASKLGGQHGRHPDRYKSDAGPAE